MPVPDKDSVSLETESEKKQNYSIAKYVTILSWLPNYTRLDAISDLVAGVTLGLTLIPQSIAYAALAGLTAQYGLYSCFVGAFIYIIFGTIKEVSIGPSSLMSILTLEYTRNMPVDFIVLFTFLAGCVELLMGILHLGLYRQIFLVIKIIIASLISGFLVDFISIPVTSGFTSATSIIIIVAQLQGLLGLKFKASSVVADLIKICQNIKNIRVPDMTLGLCSIAFLLSFRKLKDLDRCFSNNKQKGNDKESVLKKILWFLPICRNALVILITSTIAFYLERAGSTPFILSGRIQSGLPTVSLPPFSSQVGNQTYTFFDMCYHYGTGIIVLPLVSVLANVAIAKAFASGKTLNATQEMLTLGLCNIFGSLFSAMPSTGAFTRSAVISASGVRTPLAGIYVGIMALLALSFLTPYFYYIPRATLAAVLISAVVFIIDLKIIKLLWNGSKKDAFAAIVTFLVSVSLGVEIGLLTGALFNVIFLLRPSARPNIEVLQCKTQHGDKYVMIKPDAGLLYPAANYFCNNVIEIVQKYDKNDMVFIINCERIQTIDYSAIKGIEILSRSMNTEKKKLWFLNVNSEVSQNIQILGNNKYFCFIDEEDKISCIFYDDTITTNREEVKEKLLENVVERATFTLINDRDCSQTIDKCVENVDDGPEEIALMSTLSSKTK